MIFKVQFVITFYVILINIWHVWTRTLDFRMGDCTVHARLGHSLIPNSHVLAHLESKTPENQLIRSLLVQTLFFELSYV